MQALFFMAKRNMKKKKGEMLVFFFLIALATLLLYTSISVFHGTETVLDNLYDSQHTADFLFVSNGEKEKIADILYSREEVAEHETSEVLYIPEAKYRTEKNEEKKEMQFFIGRIEEERKISKIGSYEKTENQILLPYYMKAAQGIKEGDTFYLTLGTKEYELKIGGFVEDPMFATPLNISVYSSYISGGCMDNILEENDSIKPYTQYKIRLKEGEDSFEFDNRISSFLTQNVPELSEAVTIGLNWEAMRGGDMVMSNISMGIILVFSLLLMAVVLIIIRFSIHNFIEMNRKNIGIMQAAGYTSGQLVMVTILEMAMVTFAAVLVGMLLGIAGSGVVGNFEGMMIGVQWNEKFDFKSAGMSMLLVSVVVLAVAWLSGRSYKKITVLEALRGGIHTHNFKKNHFSFEKSRMPRNLIFAGKNMFFEKGKTISVFFIIALLAFASCVGAGLYQNFAVDGDMLLQIAGIEAGDIIISGDELEQIGKEMKNWKEVEQVLFYGSVSVHLESQKEEMETTCDIWKNPKQIKNEMILEGRLPKYDNEIVLTSKVANALKVKVGDTIYATGQGERLDYVVCGIDQKMNNMGIKSMLAQKGAIRLNGSNHTDNLYVYTKDGVSYDKISKKVLKHFPEVSVMDSEKQMKDIMDTVTIAMVAICIIFVSITIFVVIMVEVLLIQSKMIREQKNLGLQKALGYTTKELIGQTMTTNLPMITAGAVLGVFLSNFLMEPLIVACFSFCEMQKCPCYVQPVWMMVIVIGILLVAVVTSFLASVKIRKIEPVRMLTED